MSETFTALVGGMMQLRNQREWCSLLETYLESRQNVDWLFKNKAVVFLSLVQFNFVGLLLRVNDKFVQHRLTTVAQFMAWVRSSPLMHKVGLLLNKAPRLRDEPWSKAAFMRYPEVLLMFLSTRPEPKIVGYAKELVKRDARHALFFDVVPRSTLQTYPMYPAFLATEQYYDAHKAFAAFQLTLPGIVNAVNGNLVYRGAAFWGEHGTTTPSTQPWVRAIMAFLGNFHFAAKKTVLARPTLLPPDGMLRYRQPKRKFALPYQKNKARKKARA
jgi:hypothetical protein